MEDWRREADRAIGLTLAQRTRKGYGSVLKEFCRFRAMHQLEDNWPAPVEHLQQFMIYLYRKGLAPSSMQGKLSALAFYAKCLGVQDNTADFRVRRMVEGYGRERTSQADTRTPISPEVLIRLDGRWAHICANEYEVSLFRAASLLAFFGAFRIGELVAACKTDESRAALQLSDVVWSPEKLSVWVRRSKTDQVGQGALIELGVCSIKSLCPVGAMRSYLDLRGESKGYLFCHRDGFPLTKFQFWKITGLALDRVGLSGLRFGTHSFRIGAASTAAALGYGPDAIKKLGRWSSRRYRTYVRPLPKL